MRANWGQVNVRFVGKGKAVLLRRCNGHTLLEDHPDAW